MFKHFERFPWKGVMHLFEVSAPFNKSISFKMVERPIEVGHVLVYFYVKNEPSCTCNALFTIYVLKWRTHGTCKHVKYVLHNGTSFFWMHNLIFFQDNETYLGNNTLWCRQLSSWKILQFEECASLNLKTIIHCLNIWYTVCM